MKRFFTLYKKKILVIFLCSICFLIVLFLVSVSKREKTILTVVSTLSSVKHEWGLKQKGNGIQPDLGIENKKLAEENNVIDIGNANEKIIYLTFDVGYENGTTLDILKVLKENNVTATFFITGHYLNSAADNVKIMIDNGNIIGNHSVNHKNMYSLNDEEIESEIMTLHTKLKDMFNYEMKYFRPPKGNFNEKLLAKVNSLGYRTVMWSFAYEDWEDSNQPDLEKSKNKIFDNLHNGEIMLLHANSKTNVQILDSVIKYIKEKGYEIKALDEFVE